MGKTFWFRQHVPGFADGIEPFLFQGTIEEILTHDRIRAWTHEPGFFRFSFSEHEGIQKWKGSLMVELKNGTEWWVVGHLDGVPDLPRWVQPAEVRKVELAATTIKEIEDQMNQKVRSGKL